MKASRSGSGLVITGHPLLFTKELAVKIGVNNAIFIQQAFFMISRYGKEKDGERWLRWPIDKWHKRVFPFWSESTLHRIISEAEEKGWLRVHRDPGATALFSTDLDRLEADFEGGGGVKLKPPQGCQTDTPQGCQIDSPAPHIERDTEKRREKRETSATSLRSVAHSNRKRFELTGSIALQKKMAGGAKEKKSAEEIQKEVRDEHRVKAEKRISAHPTVESLIEWWKRILVGEGISTRTLSFTVKERGMMKNLVKQFTEKANGHGGVHLKEFIEFAITRWDNLRKKIVWENNPNRSKLGKVPTFVEVYYNREDILHYMRNPQEVQRRVDSREVYTDLRSVPKNHPNYREIAFMIKHDGKAVIQH